MTGQYVGWHGCGGIRLATDEDELDWFRQVQGFAPNIGFRMEIIDAAAIRKLNPFVTLEGVLAGAHTMDDGHVDPAGCCNALAIGARRLGAEIQRGNRVLAIERLASRGMARHIGARRDPRRACGECRGLLCAAGG